MRIKFTRSLWWKLSLYFWGIIFLTIVIFVVRLTIAVRNVGTGYQLSIVKNKVRKAAELIGGHSEAHGGLEEVTVPTSALGDFPHVSVRVMDPSGKTVSNNEEDRKRPLELSPDELARLRGGEEVVRIIQDPRPDRRFFYMASPIRKGGRVAGSFMVVIPLSTSPEVREEIRKGIIHALILSVLVSSLVALILARTFTRPIRSMEETAKEISHGDFSRRVNLKRKDEIGALGESLDEMSRKLEVNSLQRQRLMADISHEIRTPLAAIQGCAESLIDGVLETDGERERYLNTILSETRRLNVLFNDMADLARFEMGEIKVNMEPFQVNAVINKAVDGIEVFAARKNIKILKETPEEDLKAMGDRDRIMQALVILLNNAVQHIPEGREVKAGVNRVGKLLHFFVADTGDGIPQEDIPHIFERFYKVDKSRSRKGTGSGLGLAIAREIVKAHGGDITVRSSAKGTTFSFEMSINNV